MIFLISVSLVSGITGMNHYAQLSIGFESQSQGEGRKKEGEGRK
jgi:hypothetical protein